MTNPVLSIIVLSYNTADITVNCLKSILTDKGLKETPYEIIVIDNASTDDSITKIKNLKISNLQLITNTKNVGFSKGNNQGIKIAKGNYILLLNSDTAILHSAISQSLDWLSSHPEALACTAQLLNPDKSIQPTGGFFPNILNIFTWATGLDDLPFFGYLLKPFHPHTPSFYTHDSFYLHDQQLDWVTGAFLLTRHSTIDDVGGLDEDYFMYGEELEWCYRAKKTFPQSQIWYLVGPQVIHLGQASSSNSNLPYQREYQGIITFFTKHKPVLLPIIKLCILINRTLRASIYRFLPKNV